MRAITLVATLALLTACQAKEETKTDSTAAEKADVAAASAEISATQATIPTAALSGEAAVAAQELRHEKFEALGDAMKALSREAKASAPDMAVVTPNAGIIAASATALPSWFAPGTGPAAGKTEAKANIWETPDDFTAKAKDFHNVALSLNDAATSGDAAAFKAAMEPVGKACKACHETYRAEH